MSAHHSLPLANFARIYIDERWIKARMEAMPKRAPETGLRDPTVEVRVAPRQRTELSVVGDDPESVLGGEVLNPSKGDSSSCHSDQTTLEHSVPIDLEHEVAVKEALFGHIILVLRRRYEASLRGREIPELAAAIGQNYCTLHPEVLQSCQVDVRDLLAYIVQCVRTITGSSDDQPHRSADNRSNAVPVRQTRGTNRISGIPRKPR